MKTEYNLKQDSDGKWYFVEITEGLGNGVSWMPKSGTLSDCLKMIGKHEKIYSKIEVSK